MSVSEEKKKILEILWEAQKPMRPRDVAQITGIGAASLTMHLLGLKKTGHVSTPEPSCYTITEKGKEALGIPKTDDVRAREILSRVSVEKAFHFYTGINQHLGVYSSSLADFSDTIRKIEPRSIEFHTERRDFESWFKGLGDIELAKKMGVVRKAGLSGEKLREQVYKTVRSRCDELQRLSQARH